MRPKTGLGVKGQRGDPASIRNMITGPGPGTVDNHGGALLLEKHVGDFVIALFGNDLVLIPQIEHELDRTDSLLVVQSGMAA